MKNIKFMYAIGFIVMTLFGIFLLSGYSCLLQNHCQLIQPYRIKNPLPLLQLIANLH